MIHRKLLVLSDYISDHIEESMSGLVVECSLSPFPHVLPSVL